MYTRIANAARTDIMMVESTPRPTPTPSRVSFSQILAAGVGGIVQGAELAASRLPGSPITATAVRGGLTPMATPVAVVGGLAVDATPEGPGGATGVGVAGAGSVLGAAGVVGAGVGAADPGGSIDSSLQQSAQMNLYYLQIQQQVDAQNRTFTALSNVLKTEHDSAKSAIGNIHS
jgi:hypothetical protein